LGGRAQVFLDRHFVEGALPSLSHPAPHETAVRPPAPPPCGEYAD
jgi:hypothetical protein